MSVACGSLTPGAYLGVELVVEVEAVLLAVVAVAPFSPSVSPLALGASPGVPAASARAYLPWCQPSVALSSSVLQQLGQLRLVEAVEDPS
jgi:hypothetical protein